jgi:hypothetical protein
MKTGTATSAEVDIRISKMSNEFEFFQPMAVANAVHTFSEMLEEALASLKHNDLLAPYPEDYRVRALAEGDLGLEVDLHLAPGGHQRIVVAFTPNQAELRDSVDEVRSRLAEVLARLDDALALRAAAEKDARARLRRLARSGVRGRVIEARLSPIDLPSAFGLGRVEIVVEGEACNMLRPFRDQWHVNSLEDVAEDVARFRDRQRGRSAARDAALAVGAIGFVDPLALVALDPIPQGRQAALRTIARTLEQSWYGAGVRGERGHVGLFWADGIVRGVADLGGGVELSGEHVILRDTAVDATSAGRAAGEFSRHPLLQDAVIAAVFNSWQGCAMVKLACSPIPFTANGELLGSC